MSPRRWRPTACILCSENCGIEVQTDGERIARVRGDRAHPDSRGYLCQKAARLEHYQSHADRLETPLKRQGDGSHKPISWAQAIREIAAKARSIHTQFGGHAFAYYGGGGQGNHLGGVYGSALRAALGTPYVYSALAQEKTGDFWVNGRLFGRQTCHVTPDVAGAEVVLFLGTNPWQSHGFPRARRVLKELQNDPARTMIVIDPRRTETARLADLHLQLRPGTDAFVLAAMLATIVQEGLCDGVFLEQRTRGLGEVEARLAQVPVEAFCARADVPQEQVQRAARLFAKAERATVRADLGIQQSAHSTLNSYLEKLLFLLTGNFGVPGGNNLHTFLAPLIGHSPEPGEPGAPPTEVTGMHPIGKLYPPNVLPQEIDTDHPRRVRAVFVDSGNPLVTGADTQAYERAFEELDLSVTIDVAYSETAQRSDYVLPASSQLEKAEATFFNLGFPENTFHLRRAVFPPRPGTLPEPEIYRRLLVALGKLPARFPVLKRIARLDRRAPRLRLYPLALQAALAARPSLAKVATLVLYETLGPALPAGLQAGAVLWPMALRYADKYPAAVERAGVVDQGAGLGEALFTRILEGERGVVLSEHEHADTWSLVRHPDGRVALAIPRLLDELDALSAEPEASGDYPFTLMAGERRSYNANTIYRDPAWRKTDTDGALWIHPDDADTLDLTDGDRVSVESATGTVEATVAHSDDLRPGLVSLPHGYGLSYPDASGKRVETGPRINRLTASAHCDAWTKTPFHKAVPVRLVKIRDATVPHDEARREGASPSPTDGVAAQNAP